MHRSLLRIPTLATLAAAALQACGVTGPDPAAATTEFCLDGEFDLGARYQGLRPEAGEWYATTWCAITEPDGDRVVFSVSGRSNADMESDWRVAYQTPDVVRIVNADAPPDVRFVGKDHSDEARRVRRLDPRRLLAEFRAAGGQLAGLDVRVEDDRLASVRARATMPLRGDVPVEWRWDWTEPERPRLRVLIGDELVFRATGRWRDLPAAEAAAAWMPTPGAEPVEVPGDRWPARVNMRLIELAPGVHVVRGVRTGFQHLVVETPDGLVVADAPAGWIELHAQPPIDLVPGLGENGLSENLIGFLAAELPGASIHAVALTHFHDDHAGGGGAFAAAGASVYAPAADAAFLETRLSAASRRGAPPGEQLAVIPVAAQVELGGDGGPVRLVPMGPGPHAHAMLGVLASDARLFFVSDVHVPRSDEPAPRPGREATECWFAAWAVNHLPAGSRVVNSHSPEITPLSRLAAYLRHERCAPFVTG